MKLEDINAKDKVLFELSKDEIGKLNNITEQYDELEIVKTKYQRSAQKLHALEVLFWEDLINRDERCETAISRGKTLNVCKHGDNLVVVERVGETSGPYSFEYSGNSDEEEDED